MNNIIRGEGTSSFKDEVKGSDSGLVIDGSGSNSIKGSSDNGNSTAKPKEDTGED